MNFDTLILYLKDEIEDDDFYYEIKNEVLQFIKNIETKDKSVQISGGEINYQEFGVDRLRALLYKYLEGKLGEWDLEYILRAIEFEFDEEEEKVDNVIFSFSDPYLNFNITDKNVITAIQYLSGCTDSLKLEGHSTDELRNDYKSVFT